MLPLLSARLVLYVLFGALSGWGYYRFVGCRSGRCAIWANPYVATGYGALLGFLLANNGRG